VFDTVLVATDGSAAAERAVETAVDFARRFDADVHALSVVDDGTIEASPDAVSVDLRVALDEQGRAAVAAVADRAAEAGLNVDTTVREGRPAETIVATARNTGADCVALGTRGRHGASRFHLGSVAEHVTRTCPVPVLTVRDADG
jgi:nucleotide-binding universal stress UspA family protein